MSKVYTEILNYMSMIRIVELSTAISSIRRGGAFMLILNLILCLTALVAAVLSHRVEKPIWAIIISYISFSLSPIADFIDIISRAKQGDDAGIVDIYPSFLGGYIILLVVITIIIVVGVIRSSIKELKDEEMKV